jgi:hypothetical protein
MRYDLARNDRPRLKFIFTRFVDRDMVMRYHWGLAIGHLCTHGQSAPVADPDLDMQVPDNAPPRIRPEDLEDVVASSCMDADLERAAEQTFSESNDVLEDHCDMEYGDHRPSAGDNCDGDGESLDKGSEVADDDAEMMEREDETDDEAFVMMDEMYFLPMDDASLN